MNRVHDALASKLPRGSSSQGTRRSSLPAETHRGKAVRSTREPGRSPDRQCRCALGCRQTEVFRSRLPGAWMCSIFRNEGPTLSSELIIQAMAATRSELSEPPPEGLITFINPRKIRKKRDPGRCFLRRVQRGWNDEEWLGRSSNRSGRDAAGRRTAPDARDVVLNLTP